MTASTPRPPLDVVVPFAGSLGEFSHLLQNLMRLDLGSGDQVLICNNCELEVPDAMIPAELLPNTRIINDSTERSAYYARNVAISAGENPWVLFIDADCRPASGLLSKYFGSPIADGVAVLVGDIEPEFPVGRALTLAERFSLERRPHDSDYSFTEGYGPAGNMVVRRRALDEVGGFCEGILSDGDAEFGWRLRQAGWQLHRVHGAAVTHRYRSGGADLVKTWRSYGKGMSWAGRRGYGGFGNSSLAWSLRLAKALALALLSLARLRADEARLYVLDLATCAAAIIGTLESNRPDPGPLLGAGWSQVNRLVVTESWPTADRGQALPIQPTDGVVAVRRPMRVVTGGAAARPAVVVFVEDLGKLESFGLLVRLGLSVARGPARSQSVRVFRQLASDREVARAIAMLSGLGHQGKTCSGLGPWGESVTELGRELGAWRGSG